jgi:hypothetical protein
MYLMKVIADSDAQFQSLLGQDYKPFFEQFPELKVKCEEAQKAYEATQEKLAARDTANVELEDQFDPFVGAVKRGRVSLRKAQKLEHPKMGRKFGDIIMT